jgi:hypothetical protein
MYKARDECLDALKVCVLMLHKRMFMFRILTKKDGQGKSLQEMKMAIGERLYYIIHADHPEMSGKLTGMFLEATDSLDDLALLLFSPASLKLLLSQALDVLSVSF